MASLHQIPDILDNVYEAIKCFSDVNKCPPLSKKEEI